MMNNLDSIPGMLAIERAGRDPSVLQQHPFTEAMSGGISAVCADKTTQALLAEGLENRADTSRRIGRLDSDPYLFNFIGHYMLHHLRDPNMGLGENWLRDQVQAAGQNRETPLHTPNFWRDNFTEALLADQSRRWQDLRLLTTQTVDRSRHRGLVAGLAAALHGRGRLRFPRIAQGVRLADIGGSRGFVSAAMFDIDNIYYSTRYDNSSESSLGYLIESAMVIDNLDGIHYRDPEESPQHHSFVRTCCTPLGKLALDFDDTIADYESQVKQVANLVQESKMKFINTGFSDTETILSSIEPGAANVFLLSTMLHQLTEEKRQSMYRAVQQAGGDSDWFMVINDFATLPSFSRSRLVFPKDRWHGSSDPYPYATFIAPAWSGAQPRFYEVIRWKSSRPTAENGRFPGRSILAAQGVKRIRIAHKQSDDALSD